MATYSFNAEGPGELMLSEGDLIELVERVDTSWMKGRLGGKEGIFPLEFVNVIVDLPPKKAGPKPSQPTAKSPEKGTYVRECTYIHRRIIPIFDTITFGII